MLAAPGAGLGGELRRHAIDFCVEEIPLLAPTGQGPFAIVQVEKRRASTFEALLYLSQAARVSERRIGYAGLKDGRAIARQYFSLPRRAASRLQGLRQPHLRVLTVQHSEVPIRIGSLRGNRFTIRLRNVRRERLDAARQALEDLVRHGLPNAYGPQRFGARRNAHVIGRAAAEGRWEDFVEQFLGAASALEGDHRLRAARRAFERGDVARAKGLMPHKHRLEHRGLDLLARGGSPREVFEACGKAMQRLWLGAWQAHVFNAVLAARLSRGTWNRFQPGDLMWIRGCEAIVPVGSPAPDCPRLASPTGPLPGRRMEWARGAPGELEASVATQEGAGPNPDSALQAPGRRRPLCTTVEEATLEPEGESDARLRFVLLPGAFATAVVAHLVEP